MGKDQKADEDCEPKRGDANDKCGGDGDFKRHAIKHEECHHSGFGTAKATGRTGQATRKCGEYKDADGFPKPDVGAKPTQKQVEGVTFGEPANGAKGSGSQQNAWAGEGIE